MFTKRLRLLLSHRRQATYSKFHSNKCISTVNLTFPWPQLKRNNMYMKNILSPINTVQLHSNVRTETNHEEDDGNSTDLDALKDENFTENQYLYEVLVRSRKHKTIVPLMKPDRNVSDVEVQKILAKDYKDYSVTELMEDFKTVSCHANLNSIKPSEELHSTLFRMIMKYMPDLTDDQLRDLLKYLPLWLPIRKAEIPATFNELLAAFDNSLYSRMNDFTAEEMLMSCDLIFHMRRPRDSKFIDKVIIKLGYKPQKMSSDNYVHFMYLVNVARRPPPNMYELEYSLEPIVHLFDANELGIIATAFFKTRTPLRNRELVNKIIAKCTADMASMGSITLSAILKMMRLSLVLKKDLRDVVKMLDAIKSQISRLSIPTLAHTGHLAVSVCLPPSDIIKTIVEKFEPSIPNARVKDIERILLVLGTYSWPTNSTIYERIIEEMRKPVRIKEYTKYYRALSASVLYLSYVGIYPLDIIERMMSREFLTEIYRNNAFKIGPSYLIVETSLEIEVPEYKGSTLPPRVKSYLIKKRTGHIIRNNNPEIFNQWHHKMLYEISNSVKKIYGTDRVMIEQLLPHHEKPDIIFCLNTKDNTIAQQFMPESLAGPIKHAPAVPEGHKWVALVLASFGQVFRDTTITTGLFNCKLRLLEKIGYSPVVIVSPKWRELSTRMKHQYIEEKLSDFNCRNNRGDRK